jgi:hypothetical protein
MVVAELGREGLEMVVVVQQPLVVAQELSNLQLAVAQILIYHLKVRSKKSVAHQNFINKTAPKHLNDFPMNQQSVIYCILPNKYMQIRCYVYLFDIYR